ncbi:MAG: hypothetical protein QNK23_15290 [Crocinitomicaceae bacterium]|nr:hypothetical protein [Crocinitomicaceae bacterium]
MKTLRFTPFLFLTIAFITSCNSEETNATPDFSSLSTADSLAVVDSLFEEMYTQIYAQKMYQADFNPGCGFMPIEERCFLQIEMTENGEQLVNLEINEDITEATIAFYITNREQNDPTNNSPMYSRVSRTEIANAINVVVEDAKATEEIENISRDIVVFKWMIVKEWKKKLIVLETLQLEELPEIHIQAHIRIMYPENYNPREEILNPIFTSILSLRNEASLQHFNESYLSIFYRNSFTKSLEDKTKLNALEALYPLKIFDLTYSLLNNLWSEEYPPPPPPPRVLEPEDVP